VSPGNECGPTLFAQDGPGTTAMTATDQGAQPGLDSTAYPLAVSLIGQDALHRLAAVGLRVTGTCRCCGAPLVDPVSVARRLGPVCAARTERAA
jgi:hypothetical protein